MYVTAVSVDVTVHSYLWYDEMISDIQGMGCSELGKKNTIFNEHPVSRTDIFLHSIHGRYMYYSLHINETIHDKHVDE